MSATPTDNESPDRPERGDFALAVRLAIGAFCMLTRPQVAVFAAGGWHGIAGLSNAAAPATGRRFRLKTVAVIAAIWFAQASLGSIAQETPEIADPSVAARAATHLFPRLALQLQPCCDYAATESLFAQIERWDLAIVDSETVGTMAQYLGATGAVRRANPNAILLAYFSSADYIENLSMPIYSRFRSGIEESWLLRDAAGRGVPLYELVPGTWTRALNLTTPVQRYIPEFLHQHVVSSGLVDGVFYDWASTSIAWMNKRKNVATERIDLDGDGIAEPDAVLDTAWRRGYTAMLEHSRRVFPSSTVIVGNAGWNSGTDYDTLLNGVMIEQFLGGEAVSWKFGWTAVMRTYAHFARRAVAPRLSIVMANRDDAQDTAFMRFALASTLMFDGYFAFTNQSAPTNSYQTVRWYDEYAVDRNTGEAKNDVTLKGYLGRPLADASTATGTVLLQDVLARGLPADNDVWRRDFEHGRVLVNPSQSSRTVDLGREFRRIRGSSDRTVNDGAIVRNLTLAPRTGVILLRVGCNAEDPSAGGCEPAPSPRRIQ